MTLGGLLGKKADADAEPAHAAALERDELEEYLSSPLETDMDLDLLAYWKLKESTWPKHILPCSITLVTLRGGFPALFPSLAPPV